MPTIGLQESKRARLSLKGMEEEYTYVRSHFKELAQYYIPRRYTSLDEGKKTKASKERNNKILNGKGTRAARTLAAGMLAGATSPTKPWVKFSTSNPHVLARAWADAVSEILMQLMNRSNVHNALAACYLDLGVFGTSPMLIYEDNETVFRCYNLPAGEYRLMRDARQKISGLGREFTMTAQQIVERFGEDNVSPNVRTQYKTQMGRTQGNKFTEVPVCHLIEPNTPPSPSVPGHFKYREYYWEKGQSGPKYLSVAGYYEKPFVAPRWEVVGNETYGVSPGMDALPDVIQLQHMTKNRGESLDRMNRPPLVVDSSIRSQPSSLAPGGITWVPNSASVGAKPVYQVDPPLQAMVQTEEGLKADIAEGFYEDLWKAILNLRTVRSATEINERMEEKLVLLGPVINRLEDEALNDTVARILGIAIRFDLIPPPPIDVGEVQLEYDSILREAQKAIGITTIERFVSAIGGLAGLVPDTIHVVNWDELTRTYGERLSIPYKVLRTRDEVTQILEEQKQLAEQREQALIGKELSQSAKNLADAVPEENAR